VISEDVWEAVQAALDERRDPLQDELVIEHLLSHPDDLVPIDRLTSRLAAVAQRAAALEPSGCARTAVPATLATGRPARRAGRRWVAMGASEPGRSAAAAAAVLLLALVFSWLPEETSPLPTPLSSAESAPAPPVVARVLALKIMVSKTDASGTTREVHQPAGFVTTHRAARPSPEQPLRTLALAWTDSWTRP